MCPLHPAQILKFRWQGISSRIAEHLTSRTFGLKKLVGEETRRAPSLRLLPAAPGAALLAHLAADEAQRALQS